MRTIEYRVEGSTFAGTIKASEEVRGNHASLGCCGNLTNGLKFEHDSAFVAGEISVCLVSRLSVTNLRSESLKADSYADIVEPQCRASTVAVRITEGGILPK